MFLYICATGTHCRVIRAKFRSSTSTISATVHEVVQSFYSEYAEFVKPPPPTTSNRVRYDPKMFPYFEKCVGALDDTHIAAYVEGEQAPYRNRKGTIAQNVLAACDFDGNFTYILAGYEGSAHDGRVLQHAVLHGFQAPGPDYYYLADAGYTNTELTLVPYRGVRCHLREQIASKCPPETHQELFNLRHSQLRNVIERMFGVFKQRFQIFDVAPRFSVDIQVKLVYICAALHNIINNFQRNTPEFQHASQSIDIVTLEINAAEQTSEQRNHCDVKRESIANSMWQDYCRLKDSR